MKTFQTNFEIKSIQPFPGNIYKQIWKTVYEKRAHPHREMKTFRVFSLHYTATQSRFMEKENTISYPSFSRRRLGKEGENRCRGGVGGWFFRGRSRGSQTSPGGIARGSGPFLDPENRVIWRPECIKREIV